MTVASKPVATTELVRFVLARLDDEDADIRKRSRRLRDRDTGDAVEAAAIERLRVESLSRRQVVGSVQQLLVLRDQPNEKAVRDVAAQILRSLATPYAQHRGFREEWHAATR